MISTRANLSAASAIGMVSIVLNIITVTAIAWLVLPNTQRILIDAERRGEEQRVRHVQETEELREAITQNREMIIQNREMIQLNRKNIDANRESINANLRLLELAMKRLPQEKP